MTKPNHEPPVYMVSRKINYTTSPLCRSFRFFLKEKNPAHFLSCFSSVPLNLLSGTLYFHRKAVYFILFINGNCEVQRLEFSHTSSDLYCGSFLLVTIIKIYFFDFEAEWLGCLFGILK